MEFALQADQKSGVPIYVQIMDQVKHQIAAGGLQPGQQLPTIRELAVSLAVNLHTVAHAYAELEREGFLTIQRGRGTFICGERTADDLQDLREQKLDSLVSAMLAEALSLGYEPDEVVGALVALLQARERALAQTNARREREEKERVVHGQRELAAAFC